MWSALQHAKEATFGFARRHKKLVIATGVTAACVTGAYYAYNRMVQEAEKFTQQLQRQMAEHQRLQLSLASTTEESNATVQRFLPRLKSKLYALVDLESVVQELKTLDKTQKAKRNALWERAKNLALTRYFTALIAFGLWHLLVFAQVSIIGKRVFEKSKVEKDLFAFGSREEEEKAHAAAHHTFLASGLEYFLDEGLQKIKAHVEHAVTTNEQLKTWDVSRKAKVEREELNELLQSIFLSILPSPSVLESPEAPELALWRSFLIYADKKPSQNEHVISLLNDLWDLLDSDLFAPALQHSLGFLCGNAFQDLNEVVYGVTSHKIIEEEEEARLQKPAPPLAKLIPCLQSEISKLLSSGQDSYVFKYSQGVGEMETFRNFYEAIFFQQDDLVAQLI
uniref:Peroxisomal biogenesis factor 3 n=1 Tax=Globisporangium ultimum (strain ATCC 200006 / CBS 805.95 / DAOM BR144) TaxID=431595 RepID=K3X6D2_GLOUD